MQDIQTIEALAAENAALRRRLEEPEQIVAAIRSHAVDAFVVDQPTGQHVYALEGADGPYRRMVECMQEGALTLAADGTILYCNARLADLLQAPIEGLIGRPLDAYAAAGERPVLQALLREAANDVRRAESALCRADGTAVPVYVTVSPLELSGTVGLCAVVTDLTERKHVEQLKRMQETLRASEERFRLMANATPAIVWTADPTGTITFHNQRWLDYTGLTPQENADQWPARVLHPEDVARCERAWRDALEHGTDYEIEVRNRRHDGEYRWFLTRARPVRDAAGRVVEWFGSTTDIHDRKLAEEALRDADRRKDEFLATLAHELRNPLAPISNAVQILNVSGSLDPNLRAARDMIDRQLAHMVRLIDDLLDASRIGSGKVELRRQRVALAAVVEQALETSRPHVERAGHALTVSLPATPVHLNADPVRLAQVFSNLVHNACKYTEGRGQIWLSVERNGADVIVRVKDTGIGIAPQHLPRVFEMFSQVDSKPERSQGGLGIGLALVRGLVEMHGGSVAAHSAGAGQGSEFVVRLPALPGEPAVQPSTGQGADAGAATTLRRILVVDDNRDNAESLALLLRLGGNEVETAHDGVEALAVAERWRPDVV
ncbi:MAG TPA: PAS domain S-box protein, partial [Burkholderiales bacterium]|nr:PAS domain S-box protein [Burkholderiales bacterium]